MSAAPRDHRLVLASASPRRRELLATLGIPFDVVCSGIDEDSAADGLPARGLAALLAERKALHVAGLPGQENAVILAADTIVALGEQRSERILGKPACADDARSMLRLLSGKTHTVYTGVALVGPEPAGRAARVDVVATRVRFRSLSDDRIDAYIATGEPFDKAGAYGIQGHASAFVEEIRGDYYNVVGLPVARVRALLVPLFPHLAAPPAPPAVPFAIQEE